MIELRAFLPLLLPLVEQCPEMIALTQLRLACQRFCEQSFCDQRELVLDLAAGVRETALAVDGCRVIEAVAVIGPRGALRRVRGQYLTALDTHWRAAPAGELRCFTRLGADSVGWYPPPAADCTATVRVAVAPDMQTGEVADVLFNPYGQAIAYGAAAHLLLMPSRPWSMPQVATSYAQEFSAAVARAKFDVMARGNFSPALDEIARPAGYFG